MKYLIYNAGYKLRYDHKGQGSGRMYSFRKKFATQVDDTDEEYFLSLTSRDIPWCPNTPKTERPFISLSEYCKSRGLDEASYLVDFTWNN
jgi:hypothetical protein